MDSSSSLIKPRDILGLTVDDYDVEMNLLKNDKRLDSFCVLECKKGVKIKNVSVKLLARYSSLVRDALAMSTSMYRLKYFDIKRISDKTMTFVLSWMNAYGYGGYPVVPVPDGTIGDPLSFTFGADFSLHKTLFMQLDSMKKVFDVLNAANYLGMNALLLQMAAIVAHRLAASGLNEKTINTQLNKNADPFASFRSPSSSSSSSSSSSIKEEKKSL